MTAEHPEEPGRVPVRDLRELVEEWSNTNTDPTLYRDSLSRAIDELEELVAEYE